MSALLAFFSAPGPMEMMIVGVIALLLFGKRLPEVERSRGKGVTEFKRGLQGVDEESTRAASRDNYRESSRPTPVEDRPEVTAPKFEPPTSAPTDRAQV